ncbi:uncharacterized protein LOC142530527 [Primulina tabacum]|uniref:uncharacterized protein LOC142530527 n=1 Tax=Primulina tabacum TaxID=48773 RepID=UPI003F5A0168
MQASLGSNPSFIWRSLLWSRSLLQEGLRWRVCAGEKISTFQDPWIPGIQSLSRPPGYQFDLETVNTLILNGSWNETLLHKILPSYIVQEVMTLPIAIGSSEDSRYWFHDVKGKYSVKDVYKLNIGFYKPPTHSSVLHSKKWWKFLWSMSVPSKVRIFWWRALSNIIPIQANLMAHHVLVSASCHLCHHHMDSTCHALFWCPVAKRSWKDSVFMTTLKLLHYSDFIEIFLRMKDVLTKTDFETFVMRTWAVWQARTRLIHDRGLRSDRLEVDWSESLLRDYQSAQESLIPGHKRSLASPLARWKRPQVDQRRLEVDAALNEATGNYSIGGTMRDHEGHILIAFGRKIYKPISVVHGELVAIREGLRVILEQDLNIHDITTDSLLAVQAVTNPAEDFSYIGAIALDINRLLIGQHKSLCVMLVVWRMLLPTNLLRLLFLLNPLLFGAMEIFLFGWLIL